MVAEELNWSELLEAHVKEFQERYPQRKVISEIEENVYVFGDSFLLGMVVNNLLDNALKYAPKDEAITVKLEVNGDEVTASICDLGQGIQEREKKKIFHKFYRTGNEATKTAKGTGLGLFLCKKILEQHQGSITVTDNEPTGSCFTTVLKRSSENDKNG